MTAQLRPAAPTDGDGIRQVLRLAFGQDDEADLVDALDAGGFTRLSLVAEKDGHIVGHILFSDLPIIGRAGTVAALALAPLAVLPDYQNQGIGSKLVRDGLDACREQGHRIVVVVGDPRYYRRFGFSSELGARLDSPIQRPAFQAAELVPGSMTGVIGRVCYPPPFGLA
jgi:putative acetyltransferase